jgi:hypothetical protein
VAIDAACPELNFQAVVPAERFLRAVDACEGEPALRFTDKGKLVVERKPFRAMLPIQKFDTFPRTKISEGSRYPVADGLLATLRMLRPFITSDAARPWASTMLFDAEGNVYASTNAVIAMSECQAFAGGIGEIQLPVFACDELLRINQQPEEVSVDESGTTFFYAGDSWLKCQHIAAEWPTETAKKWLEMSTDFREIPKGLARSIERLLPFCPDPKFPVIHLKPGSISTAQGESEATIEGYDLGEGSFHAENLLPILACSDRIGIIERAALFRGEGFKGVVSLLKL